MAKGGGEQPTSREVQATQVSDVLLNPLNRRRFLFPFMVHGIVATALQFLSMVSSSVRFPFDCAVSWSHRRQVGRAIPPGGQVFILILGPHHL